MTNAPGTIRGTVVCHSLRVKRKTTKSKKKKRPIGWGWLVWSCLFLALYVLSVGPVVMIAGRKKPVPHFAARIAVRRFYAPLGWVYETKLFHKPLGKYLHLWAPALYDRNGNMSIGL